MSAVLDQPKTTSLSELRQPAGQSLTAVHMGFDTSAGFDLMQRGAKLLAASSLVPKEYIGNIPNCVIALNMANRIGADPLLVMQNLYVVDGRPGWSSKFLIASFNQCGRFSAIRYEWNGKSGEEGWGCKAYSTEKSSGEKITGPLITIALAKKEGWYEKNRSKWKTIPELMLMYRAAGWLVNTHAPEISMGLNTVEELGDVFEAAGDGAGNFAVTTESLRTVDKTTGEIAAGAAAGAPAGNVIEGEKVGDGESAAGAADAGGDGGAPTVNYEALLKRIENATDVDLLDTDASLIGQVPEQDRQNNLAKAYQKRRAELTAPKKK
jgi:hypothetical protein